MSVENHNLCFDQRPPKFKSLKSVAIGDVGCCIFRISRERKGGGGGEREIAKGGERQIEKRKRERDRERERERQRETETETETDRQRQRHQGKCSFRQLEKWR